MMRDVSVTRVYVILPGSKSVPGDHLRRPRPCVEPPDCYRSSPTPHRTEGAGATALRLGYSRCKHQHEWRRDADPHAPHRTVLGWRLDPVAPPPPSSQPVPLSSSSSASPIFSKTSHQLTRISAGVIGIGIVGPPSGLSATSSKTRSTVTSHFPASSVLSSTCV